MEVLAEASIAADEIHRPAGPVRRPAECGRGGVVDAVGRVVRSVPYHPANPRSPCPGHGSSRN